MARDRNGRKIPQFEGSKVGLAANPDGTLKMTVGARIYKHVRVRLGRPLFEPNEFASALDRKGNEIAMLLNLAELPPASRRVLEDHRQHYDLTCKILKINSLSHMYGSAFWDVETDKGRREFVIRGTTAHVRWLEDTRVLVTDVRGNRFEIPDLDKLDNRSNFLFHMIL